MRNLHPIAVINHAPKTPSSNICVDANPLPHRHPYMINSIEKYTKNLIFWLNITFYPLFHRYDHFYNYLIFLKFGADIYYDDDYYFLAQLIIYHQFPQKI